MARRHERNVFFIVDRRVMRGEVNRAATPSEMLRSFRFSEIVKEQEGEPTHSHSDELLKALAEAMTAEGDDSDSDIPAGFTYLGQFVDHDLTRDRTDRPFNTSVSPEELVQARSPALDLDSVYGLGPTDPGDAIFYDADRVRLKLGRSQESGPGPVATSALDGFDLPRKGADTANPLEVRQAQIADPRNDENLAVGQTHLAFMRFHNKVCDRLAASTPSTMLFQTAREQVVKHYQWMLKTDLLPRIVDNSIVDDVFTNGRKVCEKGSNDFPTMPIEFSVAAYRLGHSMVRDKYNWNAVFSQGGAIDDLGTLLNLFRFSGTSGNLSPGSDLNNPLDGRFERLPTNWVADFTRLYDFVKDGTPELAPEFDQLNKARPIDIHITNPLADLPLGAFDARGKIVEPIERNLAFRNLVRARMVGLATGQEVVSHFQNQPDITVEALTPEQIVGDELGGLSQALRDELTANTPLWFYILREAQLNGGRLAGVGGRIVAETFHRAMEGSSISILRDPSFKPHLGAVEGRFNMTDLLLVAYDASNGEIRPLSPDAPRPAAPAPGVV